MPSIPRTSSEGRNAITGAWWLIPCGLFILLLCAGAGTRLSNAISTSPGDRAATETRTPALGGQNKAVEAATLQLAKTLKVDVTFLSVESMESAWWPDSCLGIPRPDEICEPIRTPGFRVVLAAGQYRFIYRTDLTGENVRLEDLTTDRR